MDTDIINFEITQLIPRNFIGISKDLMIPAQKYIGNNINGLWHYIPRYIKTKRNIAVNLLCKYIRTEYSSVFPWEKCIVFYDGRSCHSDLLHKTFRYNNIIALKRILLIREFSIVPQGIRELLFSAIHFNRTKILNFLKIYLDKNTCLTLNNRSFIYHDFSPLLTTNVHFKILICRGYNLPNFIDYITQNHIKLNKNIKFVTFDRRVNPQNTNKKE